MQNHTKGVLYASVTAFFWGFLAIALKVAAREVDPNTIVWFRFAVAFSFLAGWHLFRKPAGFRILIRPPWMLIVAALGLSWNYMGFMLGIHYTTPSNAQLFIQTGPITLALVGIIFYKERINLKQIIGFLIAITGLLFFYNQQLEVFISSGNKYNIGVLFTLSGAMAWAIYASFQKKLVTRYHPQTLNLFLFGLPALLYLPFINLTPLFSLHWTWWLLMVFLGLNTLIAYGFLASSLKYLEANKISIIIILNPMITFATMGFLTYKQVSWITHERFTLLTIFGALMVFAGAVLVVGAKKQKKQA